MKGGQYVISMTDEKGDKVEKSVTELSQEDIERLANPQAPKTMEDLAKEQLDTLKSVDASLKAPSSRTGYAVASMSGVEKAITELRGVSNKITKVFNVDELSVKDVRTNLETDFGLISTAVKGFVTGDVGSLKQLGEGVDGLVKYMDKALLAVETEAEKQFKGTVVGDVVKAGVNTVDQSMGTSNIKVQNNDKTIEVKDFIIKTLPQDELVMAGGTSLIENKNSTVNENKNTSDINLNLTITADNRVDKDHIIASVKEALRNTGVIQELTKATEQASKNYNTNPW